MYESKEFVGVKFSDEEKKLLEICSRNNRKKGGIVNELDYEKAGYNEGNINYTIERLVKLGLVDNLLVSPKGDIACTITEFGLSVYDTLEESK